MRKQWQNGHQVATMLGLNIHDGWAYGSFHDLAYFVDVMQQDYADYEYNTTGIYLSQTGKYGTYQIRLRGGE